MKKARHHNTTHGREGTPEYRIWIDMRRRCSKPQRPDYHRYGGRGIVVCDRWRDPKCNGFQNFIDDMGERPSKKHSLERKDNDGPYSKANCIWAVRAIQDNNRRTSRFVVVDGRRVTVTQASRAAGLSCYLVFGRLLRGWTIERALATRPSKPGDKRGPRGPYKTKPRSSKSARSTSR